MKFRALFLLLFVCYVYSPLSHAEDKKRSTDYVAADRMDKTSLQLILSVKVPNYCDQVATPTVIQDEQNPHLITITPNVIEVRTLCIQPVVEKSEIVDLPTLLVHHRVLINADEMYTVRFTGLEKVLDVLGSQLFKHIEPQAMLQ